MRRHVVGPLGVVAVARSIAVGHERREVGLQILPHRRIGVLAQDQRRAGVLAEHVGDAVDLRHHRRDLAGDVVGAAAAGVDDEAGAMDRHQIRSQT